MGRLRKLTVWGASFEHAYGIELADNMAFQGAFRKGWFAAKKGEPKKRNPYGDWRTGRGSVTWSRAFIRAWDRGWETYHRIGGR